MGKEISFTKMQGAGNDYIYVDTFRFTIDDPAKAAIAWSDRRKGIGADGLVLIGPSPTPEADFSMLIFNADGSQAQMCGNAARCVGKYLRERGLSDKSSIRLHTLAGVRTVELRGDDISVEMGVPLFEDGSLFIPEKDPGSGTFVSIGNPHYVIFTGDPASALASGEALEHHEAFPERCNIEFARILPDGSIEAKVWERGSGITASCGTGACAIAAVARLKGLASARSSIIMDGGTLVVEFLPDGRTLLFGPTSFVFDGLITLE